MQHEFKVLVVDEQKEVLQQIGDIISLASISLEEDKESTVSFKVDQVQNYDKALERIGKERFEVVLIGMFIGNSERNRKEKGLEMVRKLELKSSVTIVISSHPDLENCVESVRAGAWDYLNKDSPKLEEKLINSIREGCKMRLKQPDLGRPNPNAQWVSLNLEILAQKYGGKIIAVLDEEIVHVTPSFEEMIEYLNQQFFLVQPYIFSVPDLKEESV